MLASSGVARSLRGLDRYKWVIAALVLVLTASGALLARRPSDGTQWSDPPLIPSRQPAASPAIAAPPPAGDLPPPDVEQPPGGAATPGNGSARSANPPAPIPAGAGGARPAPSTRTPTGQITGIGGMCVDVAGANDADGTPVQLHPCTGVGAQRWVVGVDGTLRALGKCMDVRAGGTDNGTAVQVFSCNGSAAQRWTPNSGRLINTGSGRCLDATDLSSADGTRLQIWDCNGGANQNWTLPR
jgi:hypothetical protein